VFQKPGMTEYWNSGMMEKKEWSALRDWKTDIPLSTIPL
jgi:hypothetical protein